MKILEYSVAWIDDQPGGARGHEDRLRTMLGRQGLDLKVEWVSTKDNLERFIAALRDDSPYDLILVDWKLGMMVAKDGSGATVAKQVRDAHSHANIIFYSSAKPADLRQEIAKQLIDGVWCVNREHFMVEVKPIVQAALRRIDLNAMRGLFVAAVAEFDHKIKGALIRAHAQLQPTRQVALASLHVQRKVEYLQEQLDAIKALDVANSFPKMMADAGTYDLVTLLLEFNSMVDAIDAAHRGASAKLANYGDEIITPRNDLAHARSTVEEGKMKLSRGGRTYDMEKFSELRLHLADHDESLLTVCEVYLDRLVEAVKGKD